MMSDLSSKTALVVDGGLFLPLVHRLSRDFGKVLLYVPGGSPFPTINDAVIGDGFDDIERVHDLWQAVRKSDIVVFPDVGQSDLQLQIEQESALSAPVWGSREGDRLELERAFLKDKQAEWQMAFPDYSLVKGLTDLRDYMRSHQDVYVKLSRYRGAMETHHSVDYETSLPWLDGMAVKLGPIQEFVTFIVEDALEAVVELGFDGFSIDGKFPDVAVHGIEQKGRGYIGCVRPYKNLPSELVQVNSDLSSFLNETHYRNFFSTEVRVSKDGIAYLTDPSCRHASPAGECLDELYSNLGEIIWEGAKGNLVEPVYSAKFAVQALIDHPGDKNAWRIVDVPPEARQWVKLYFECEVGGKICLPPFPWSDSTIGSVIGLGDSIESAIEDMKAHASALDGQGLMVHTDAVADVLREIREAEKAGVEITDQPVPKASTVMEEA